MKKYVIGVLVLAVLGFATYSIQQQFGVGNFNLASVLGSTSTSTLPTNCQSPFLIAQLQSEVDTLNQKIASLAPLLKTTSSQLASTKASLAKAKTAEAAALKAYTAAEKTYPPKLTAADKKITDLNTKIATSTRAQLAVLNKQLATARTDYAKLFSAYNAIIAKYKAAENTRKQLESQVATLTDTEAKLKSGVEKAELTAQLDTLTNGTTGTLTLLKKKPSCPSAETRGKSIYDSMCRDSIDNDGNGKTDCDDSVCTNDKYCKSKIPSNPTKPTTPTVPTTPTQPTSGCSISGYTDKASCENATIWVAGGCSDSAYASQSDCEANGGTYTQGSDQPAGGQWTEPGNGDGDEGKKYIDRDACELASGVGQFLEEDFNDFIKEAAAKVNCNLEVCRNSPYCIDQPARIDPELPLNAALCRDLGRKISEAQASYDIYRNSGGATDDQIKNAFNNLKYLENTFIRSGCTPENLL